MSALLNCARCTDRSSILVRPCRLCQQGTRRCTAPQNRPAVKADGITAEGSSGADGRFCAVSGPPQARKVILDHHAQKGAAAHGLWVAVLVARLSCNSQHAPSGQSHLGISHSTCRCRVYVLLALMTVQKTNSYTDAPSPGSGNCLSLRTHIDVDANSGLAHIARDTSGNMSDVTEVNSLLNGEGVRLWFCWLPKRAQARGCHLLSCFPSCSPITSCQGTRQKPTPSLSTANRPLTSSTDCR